MPCLDISCFPRTFKICCDKCQLHLSNVRDIFLERSAMSEALCYFYNHCIHSSYNLIFSDVDWLWELPFYEHIVSCALKHLIVFLIRARSVEETFTEKTSICLQQAGLSLLVGHLDMTQQILCSLLLLTMAKVTSWWRRLAILIYKPHKLIHTQDLIK